MPCYDEVDLEHFLSGDLAAEAHSLIESHVARCAHCSARLSEVKDNVAFIADLQSDYADDTAHNSEFRDASPPPRSIGQYDIIREIGRGGMGVVYEGRQKSPPRTVAVKVLNQSRSTDPYSARLFQREAMALARLDHPSIASVYEAGATDDVRPFFAMEYIAGETLTAYAEHHALDTHARLELFIQLCDAIAFAHLRGVIHRDLKPSNVLVRADGSPKVLDFGLAKIVESDADAADRSIVTQIGRVFGTLPYMSPEQVRGDSRAVDTRSDVYSLGVMLYELLAGALPYDLDPSSIVASARTIGEVLPRRPSSVKPQLKGDLENIMLKALEKAPESRYPSAAALRDDLLRFRRNEPITARAHSAVYYLRKLAQRNKPMVTALATIVVVLILGASIATWQAIRATGAERDAESHLEDAQREVARFKAVNQFLEDMLASVNPEDSPGQLDVTVRDILDKTTTELANGQLDDQAEVEAAIRTTIGNAYRALGCQVEAEMNLRAAVAILREIHSTDHQDLAYGIHKLARLLAETAAFDEAEQLSRESMEMRIRLFGEEHEDVATSMNNLGWLLKQRDRLDEAEPLLRRAIELHEGLPGAEETALASALNNLALLLFDRGSADAQTEGERILRRSLDIDRRARGGDHPNVAATMSNLGVHLVGTGRAEEAEGLLREAIDMQRRLLGDDHPSVAVCMHNLAQCLTRLERFDEAETLQRDAIEIHRRAQGGRHPNLAGALNNLAASLMRRGRAEEAEPLLREALDIRTEMLGEDHVGTLETTFLLGEHFVARHLPAEAESFYRTAVERARVSSGGGERWLGLFLLKHGQCLAELDRLDEAEQSLTEARRILAESVGEAHRLTAEAYTALAELALARSGQPDRASDKSADD